MGELEAGEGEVKVEPCNAPGMRRRRVPAAIRQLKRPPTLTGWVAAGPGDFGAVCPGEETALTFAVESRGWVVGRGVRAGDSGGDFRWRGDRTSILLFAGGPGVGFRAGVFLSGEFRRRDGCLL